MPIGAQRHDSTDLVTHVATGNVMTGVGTTRALPEPTRSARTMRMLTAVSSNNVPAHADNDFDGSGNLVVEGQFGTLTIKADGSYVYTAHQDAPGGSSDVFTYTLTDGDGDPAQATLTITNPDHMPSAGANAVVQLDDDALPGGNPGGVGDDVDSAHTTGTLSGSGGDGALSFVLTADGAPAGFTYALQDNGNLWVMQGSTHVLTITADSATGAYTVTQVAPIDHPAGDNENNVEFGISYTVTDADGDPATGHLTVNVDDDTPVARNDTDGLDSAGHAAGNVITGVGTTSGSAGADGFGADGPGQLTGVSSNGTGQSDTSFDSAGNLVVHGSFGTLTIDANGEYTYVRDPGSTAAGSEVFTYTIVDGDGDPTTATLTLALPALNKPPTAADSSVHVSEEGLLPNGIPDSNGTPDQTDSPTASGNINAVDPDGNSMTITLSAPSGTFTSGGAAVHWAVSPDGHTLTGYTGGDSSTNHVVVVTIDNTGHYDVQLIQPFDDPNASIEDFDQFRHPGQRERRDGQHWRSHHGDCRRR